jgi:hypothetical protein
VYLGKTSNYLYKDKLLKTGYGGRVQHVHSYFYTLFEPPDSIITTSLAYFVVDTNNKQHIVKPRIIVDNYIQSLINYFVHKLSTYCNNVYPLVNLVHSSLTWKQYKANNRPLHQYYTKSELMADYTVLQNTKLLKEYNYAKGY